VPCIDANEGTARGGMAAALRGAALLTLVVAAGCGNRGDRAPGETPGATSRATPPTAVATAPTAPAAAPAPAADARRPLPPPTPRRNWNEVRQQAAERLVAANPDITYMGRVPDQLLAIPVLEVELNGDGSVRRIEILREPRQARETTKIAVDAIRRAAPFGDVSRLPRPWKFVETFLFDDDRKFKPRTLDR
jgi:hypothetical protein